MKFIFDTHAFIWWDSQSSKLSPQTLAFCKDRTNILLLSIASVWEMQIKLQLGKLRLNMPLAKVIGSQQEMNGIEVLPIMLPHVLELDKLPEYHKDPFDRLLIAQARVEDAVLISNDSIFTNYPVKLLW